MQHDYHTQASWLNNKVKKSWEKVPPADIPEGQAVLLALVPPEATGGAEPCPTVVQRQLPQHNFTAQPHSHIGSSKPGKGSNGAESN